MPLTRLRARRVGDVDIAPVITNRSELLTGSKRTSLQGRLSRQNQASLCLTIRDATTSTLPANELMNSASKHCELYEPTGEEECHQAIHVEVFEQHGTITFAVEDAGPGFPEGFAPNQYSNVGLELVTALARSDLQDGCHFRNVRCTYLRTHARVEIVFPERPPSDRSADELSGGRTHVSGASRRNLRG